MIQTLAIANYRSLRHLVVPLGRLNVITGGGRRWERPSPTLLGALGRQETTPASEGGDVGGRRRGVGLT
jgi:hypothetical protein